MARSWFTLEDIDAIVADLEELTKMATELRDQMKERCVEQLKIEHERAQFDGRTAVRRWIADGQQRLHEHQAFLWEQLRRNERRAKGEEYEYKSTPPEESH